jgi:predicted TIM-barrel fold metal-dependent hydrolase
MDRLRIDRAWVGHLGAPLLKDPAPANADLERVLRPHDRLLPVPTINVEQPRWEDDLNLAVAAGAPAVRIYPQYQGLDAHGDAARVVVTGAAALGLPVIVTVRLEDARQRHPLDLARDLTGAELRGLIRSDPQVKILVTHADRALVEEVHFGLTLEETRRALWEISWVWGPLEDDLARLVRSVGAERLTFGTGSPLRIPDATVAKLDLLECDAAARRAIEETSLTRWLEAGHPESTVWRP